MDKNNLKTFALGGELIVNRIGYGAMRLTGQPGNFGAYADWEAGKRLLRQSLELGVNFIDTAEAYGPGWNEEIIADALFPYPPELVVATKGGITKTSPSDIRADGSPENLRRGCEASLRRLKVEQIFLYQLHRPDPQVPFADSIGALAELQSEGKIRRVGLSNVSVEQIEEARGIVEIASVQNRFNVAERASDAVVDYCHANGIAFLPYGPLGANPMKHGAPLAAASSGANEKLAEIARANGATPGQIALAWLLRRAENTILIPGTTSAAHLEENAAASAIDLSQEDYDRLSEGF